MIREPSPGAAEAGPGGASPAPVADPSFSAAEAAAIRGFLAGHPSLRVASDGDARLPDDADDVSRLYGVYHPYFVRGDIDDDGVLDFVVALVDRQKRSAAPWFSIVAFRADGSHGFRQGQMIESAISLEAGDISIDRDAIVITPDLGETDSARRYRWNPRERRFDFVADEDLAPDPTPSNRI